MHFLHEHAHTCARMHARTHTHTHTLSHTHDTHTDMHAHTNIHHVSDMPTSFTHKTYGQSKILISLFTVYKINLLKKITRHHQE